MSIAEQFEDKIKAGQLATPIPRWQVLFKRTIIWIALGLFLIVGAVSVGIFAWFLLDPVDLIIDTGKFNLFGRLLDDLPLFWAIISLACSILAVLIFTKSTRGYRFRVVAVIISCVIAFLALGAAMAFGGISDKIEGLAFSYLPPYRSMAQPLAQKLMKPQIGNIVGKASEVSASVLELTDPSGNVWRVKINSETKLPAKRIQPGSCLRASGEVATGTREMKADIVGYCPRGVRLRTFKEPVEIRTSTMRIINYAPSMVWLRMTS